MALNDRHPQYTERLADYIQMADTYAGERAVKAKRLDYLPATEGMVQDGMQTTSAPGWKDYEAYLLRAHFYDGVRDGVKAMLGVLQNKPAVFELPVRLQPLLERATLQGEGLQMLLRRINVAQLLFARCGLLADAPTGMDVDKATPYLAFYQPQQIINWDEGQENEGQNKLQLVVIDESGFRREGFTWKDERKYRVLTLGGAPSLESGWDTPPPDAQYAVAVKVNDESMPTESDFIIPQIGAQTLNEIPFVFIGANDLVPEPEIPPLLGLSNLCLAIYRAEADYRQTLYMQGQQTLVIIGGAVDETDPSQLRTGAKGLIELKIGGEAMYIGVSADGLGEMRQSLMADKTAAAMEGIQFLDVGDDKGSGSSGEALRIRVAAKTTTLSGVAKAAGQGLENLLKICAVWVGEDPEEVVVKPTTDFSDQTVQGAALLAFMQAKQLGLPLSLQSLHGMMLKNDMTELSFDEENEQIEAEAETMLGTMVSPLAQDVTDDSFLDENNPVDPDPNAGSTVAPAPTAQPAPPNSTAPPNKNVPVTPTAGQKGHTRGSPVPLKRKVGKKGASAGK